MQVFMLERGMGTWEGNNKEVSRDIARFFYLLTSSPPAGTMIRVTSLEKSAACFSAPKHYFTNIFKIFSVLHHLDIGHPLPQELAVTMEGDEVLHNGLCVT